MSCEHLICRALGSRCEVKKPAQGIDIGRPVPDMERAEFEDVRKLIGEIDVESLKREAQWLATVEITKELAEKLSSISYNDGPSANEQAFQRAVAVLDEGERRELVAQMKALGLFTGEL